MMRQKKLHQSQSNNDVRMNILFIVTLLFQASRCFISDPLTKCYGKYGCISLKYPWYSSHRVVNLFPKSAQEIEVNFFLYTKHNRRKRQELFEDDKNSIAKSHFNATKMTFIITHGYLEHGKKNWLLRLKEKLLKHGDYNVIVLDWLPGSGPPYTQATANTRLVGSMAAHFLKLLHDSFGLDMYKVHMIGHSLGAHLSGYVGSNLKSYGLELGRITGLDPAEPHFEHTHPMVRLDETDAYYVDVIHTDANPLMSFGLGLWQKSGHSDFYPNGGRIMSGCQKGIMNHVAEEKGNLAYALRRVLSCNHIRSYEYFIDSINPENCQFVGVECDTWEDFISGQCPGCNEQMDNCDLMGFYAFSMLNGSKPNRHKTLYLYTDERSPFCTTHYRVTIVLSDTLQAKKQGGDRGNFRMVLHGDNGSSVNLLLNRQEAFFEPGRVYHFMTITQDIGHVKSADLTWEYASHPLNPLTWRINSKSIMFVNRVEISAMKSGHTKKHTFCADDAPFASGQAQNVVWKPTCRDNAPDPGNSLLGVVLNADPIGNAKFVINKVNPLVAANPLTGLAVIGNSVTGFTASVQHMTKSMGDFMRRMDLF